MENISSTLHLEEENESRTRRGLVQGHLPEEAGNGTAGTWDTVFSFLSWSCLPHPMASHFPLNLSHTSHCKRQWESPTTRCSFPPDLIYHAIQYTGPSLTVPSALRSLVQRVYLSFYQLLNSGVLLHFPVISFPAPRPLQVEEKLILDIRRSTVQTSSFFSAQ